MVVATTRLHAVFFSHIHSVKIPSKATVINLHYYCKKYLTNLLGEFVTAISGYYKKKNRQVLLYNETSASLLLFIRV